MGRVYPPIMTQSSDFSERAAIPSFPLFDHGSLFSSATSLALEQSHAKCDKEVFAVPLQPPSGELETLNVRSLPALAEIIRE